MEPGVPASGSIIFTERLPGRMRILHTDGTVSASLAGVSAVLSPGAKDIGLLDVVLDPDFANNKRVFFSFFNYIDNTNTNRRIARARLDEKSLPLTDVTVIFRGLTVMPSSGSGQRRAGYRDRQRRQSADDPGDRSDSPPWKVARKLDNQLGKIIRITPDGAPPADNPFIGKAGVLPEIWAYGMRSPEGRAFDPHTGRLWQNDHGPRGGDELNIVEKGKNYGRPLVAHGIDYPGATIGVMHMDGWVDPSITGIRSSRHQASRFIPVICFRNGRTAFSSADCAARCSTGSKSRTTKSLPKSRC